MCKITTVLLICMLHQLAYAQEHTKASLLATGESLATEMGKTYQRAQNCNQKLDNIAAPSADRLFQNYFEEHEIRIIMKQYTNAVAEESGNLCNLEAINVQALIGEMGNFMRQASRFSK